VVQLGYFSYEEKHWHHSVVLGFFQDLVMDILRVLSTPDLEVRKKTLQLALDLVSSRNVEEVKTEH
jgi:vesicle coat complex subunit